MKKILYVLLALSLAAGVAWADATWTSTVTPKAGRNDYMSGGGVAVTDPTDGYVQQVDSDGAAQTIEKAQTIAQSTALFGGTALVSSACRVSTITYGGNALAAGAFVLIYDAASATGTAKYDISVGTAKGTEHLVIPGGAIFSTGVFAQSDSAGHITITYDN